MEINSRRCVPREGLQRPPVVKTTLKTGWQYRIWNIFHYIKLMFILLNTDITLYKGGWLFYICICQRHPYPLADKNLLASFLNMYSNSCVGFLAVASYLHIANPLLVTTHSSEVRFTSLSSGDGEFETLLVWRAKSSFFF